MNARLFVIVWQGSQMQLRSNFACYSYYRIEVFRVERVKLKLHIARSL